MSEEKREYLADQLAEAGYVAEAVQMLGAGYGPAATIESPRTVRELTENGLVETKAWGWVKISAKFKSHIRILRGAKLAIWQCIALSIDEQGKCNLTIKELSAATGYSHTEVIDSIKELQELGYLGVDKTGKKNIYTPEFAARGVGNDPSESVKKLDSTPAYQYESSPSEEKSHPSINRVKRVNGTYVPNGIEGKIFAGLPVEETDLQGSSFDLQKAIDVSNLIGTGQAGADGLALAFQKSRKINFPMDEKKIKSQRKAAREMLEMHVKPQHVQEAVKQLLEKNMTVTDLYSVSKTAISLANPANTQPAPEVTYDQDGAPESW